MSDSYRVTFDASHKAKAGGGHVNGFLHHVARDLDDANGVAREHANRNIDRARTAHNVTVVPDGQGGWRRPASVDELTGRLDARLGTLKKAPRDGAVLMRPIVANLSPEWFAENNPDWQEHGLNDESRAAYDALLQQAVEEFGADNIVVASLHMDETLPQWQIAVAMVTDDGRLTQKPWYPGPTALTTMGKRFRQAVADTGIAVNFTPAARSKEHLSGEEFGRRADMLREAQADAEANEAALDTMVESLETRRANVAAREAKAREDAEKAARDAEEAAQARARAEEAERAAEAERARLAATTPDLDWFLDRPRKDGKTFRSVFEREVAERRRLRQRIDAAAALAEEHEQQADDGFELGGGSIRPTGSGSLFGQVVASSSRPSLPTSGRSMAAKLPKGK